MADHEKNLKRLDQALVEQGFFYSRTQAQKAIVSEQVEVNGRVSCQSSLKVTGQDTLTVKDHNHYVGRGALKLLSALEFLKLSIQGQICLDVGASTGGFTQILIEKKAKHVIALDVGHGQLHPSLREIKNIECLEGINARYPFELSRQVDFCVMDVSFISQRHIIPQILPHLRESAHLLTLWKPQFEIRDIEKNRHGVIQDIEKVNSEREKFRSYLQKFFFVENSFKCSLTGKQGNQEWWFSAVHISQSRLMA